MHQIWDDLYSRLGDLDELQIVTAPPYLWHARYIAWTQRWAFDRAMQRIGGVAGKRVLDIGCGAGRWSRRLRDLGATVTAVDYSKEAIARARERIPRVDFVVADLVNDDLGSGRYDVVLSATVLALLAPEEQDVAVASVDRAVVRDGWLVAMEDMTDNRRMPGVRTLMSWRRLFESHGFRARMIRGFRYDLPIRAPLLPMSLLRATGRTPGPLPASVADPGPSRQPSRPPRARERRFEVLFHPRVLLSYALEPACRATLPDRLATHGLFVLRHR